MARLDVTEIFHGITFPGHLHTQESLCYATDFKFQDADILIVTYPKSGTTWMQELITLVLCRGDPKISQTQPNWARAPWIEQYYCPNILKALKGPRLLTTHLPYKVLAPALQGSKAKVIYVARNPKDVIVSYYYFHKMANFLTDPGTFSEFLSSFLDGKVYYGSWFDHVKEWTNNERNNDHFLYITYEEMWEEIMDHSKGRFMRKGQVGDWVNTFSKEQSHIFDVVYNSKMVDSMLTFVWERKNPV
ncbi:sulfotransferase family 5A, member 1 isoform X2 [Silurus meridionalis]|uniref:sulfotransferase family 5A, member 1 isoform X2 n=1 Tax=Silurus meridionalis TaxID=175797 RepID=UPI001EEBC08C|nr:sulfotransferase family 5A, member 1 isoform X2 [Silurus meridionalis]